MKPCEKKIVESKTLNFTHADHGRCVSPPLDVGVSEHKSVYRAEIKSSFRYLISLGNHVYIFKVEF